MILAAQKRPSGGIWRGNHSGMTIFVFLALIVVVSIIVSIVVATTVIRAPFYDIIGPFSAGLLGAAACFVLAYCGFFILDPDPVSEFDIPTPLYLRTLPITGLSAIIWLPVYMTIFSKLSRKRTTA
ncbi:MAG: hypothetical protein ACI8Q6_000977 [Granulosicoccus sp.]